MPKIVEIKNRSGQHNTPLTIEQLEALCGLELLIGTYSELNQYKTELDKQYSIPINNFGRFYLGVELESTRGVQIFFDKRRDLYQVSLNYPCGLNDNSLFEKLVDAIITHTGARPVFLEGNVDSDDPLDIWRQLFHKTIEKPDSITIQGLRLEISMDTDFLNELESAENLLYYFHSHQWIEDYFIATPDIISSNENKGIGVWVNTIDLPTIYPITPMLSDNYNNLDITNWLLSFYDSTDLSNSEYSIEYDKFINYCEINEIDMIGINHFKKKITRQQMKSLLKDYGIPLKNYL